MALALDDKIVAIERTLAAARIPHAFGGALALAYYATPRGTHDIDLNVFLPVARAERVLSALEALGVDRGDAGTLEQIRVHGQIRLHWEHTPIDLFFAYDALHESCAKRIRAVPFGDGMTISILLPEDLAIFKMLFDRPKDWSDLAEILFSLGAEFDAGYAVGWLRRILAKDDARLARFEQALRSPGA
jgi:hypothetical protein